MLSKKELKKIAKMEAELQAKKDLKRQELKRELAAQAKRRKELEENWMEMMVKIKEPLFKKDIEIMWHTFERAYDRKDCYIQHTVDLINTADDQYQRTIASFCDSVDTTINKFLSDLEEISKENTQKINELLKYGEDIAAQIADNKTKAETQLQLLIYHEYTTADNLAWTNRGEFLVREEEEETKFTNIREDLRSFLENVYTLTWEQYKAVLKNYVQNTAENQKQVRKLRVKENVMSDIIAKQGKLIANSDNLLKKLRGELAAYESGTKQAVFRERRDRYRAACANLKKQLLESLEKDEKQMALLVEQSDTAVAWLEAAEKKAEKILRLAALCRKFETQKEKVLPYGTAPPPLPALSLIDSKPEDDPNVISAMASTSGLTKLWHRVARSDLVRRALLREKIMLEQENSELVASLEEGETDDLFSDAGKISNAYCPCNEKTTIKNLTKVSSVDAGIEFAKYQQHK